MAINLERYARRHPYIADALTTVALFGFAVLGGTLSTPDARQPTDRLPVVLLAVVSCLALLAHRRHPRTAVAVTMACALAASGVGYLLNPLLLAPAMAALYWLAALTDRETTRVFLLASLSLMVLITINVDPGDHPLILKTLAPCFWMLLPVVAGSAARLRLAYVEAVQARAEYAERSREEEARHRVAEERLRIARELHDVVAHHLALANAQAGTAAHLARTHPAQAEKILADLAGTTSTALREMKATVSVLRRADDPAASLAPSPGLGRLAELTDAFAVAGLAVHVGTEGTPRPLSPGVDLTAYRIVQEALTNVSKHASADTAHVLLRYGPDLLTITVTDDGDSGGGTAAGAARGAAAVPAPGQGFGLIGMRERARSVGGVLEAGPRVEGGFEVTTELPLYSIAPEPEVRTP